MLAIQISPKKEILPSKFFLKRKYYHQKLSQKGNLLTFAIKIFPKENFSNTSYSNLSQKGNFFVFQPSKPFPKRKCPCGWNFPHSVILSAMLWWPGDLPGRPSDGNFPQLWLTRGPGSLPINPSFFWVQNNGLPPQGNGLDVNQEKYNYKYHHVTKRQM